MSEPEAEASTRCLDSRLDDMKLKLDYMDSRLFRIESTFTIEFGHEGMKLLAVLVAV